MTSAAERNMASAEAHYQAMNSKDPAGMARTLHPDVRFISPLADLNGKEAVLDAAKRLLTLLKGVKVHAKFGSESQAMLTYDLDFAEPMGICRTAVLMTFKDGLIARIELFFDARPFGKN
jgi:ketosteroid isomerase-like protein